jgi:endonuclease/exonuclease/phosphatase family metal-dependent hydrolase
VRGLCEAELPVWTWNVKHFPLTVDTTEHVALTLADVEIVGFQEVDDVGSFEQLLGQLPGWAGLAGRYGFGTQVAIAWRADRLTLVGTEDLWADDPELFPRPVLAVTFEIAGRVGRAQFTVIDVHLKAMIDADSQRRRREAIVVIEQWLATKRAAGERVIALGDWNDAIDDVGTANVFAPILARPDAYTAVTAEVAARDGYSYIPFRTLIDHVVMTREATELLQVQAVDPVPLEQTINGYTSVVSDHRPVRVLTIPVLPAP